MPRSNLSLFAICVLIWGSTWIAITFQLGTVAPELSVGYRFVVASLVLFAFCWWRGLSLRFNRTQHLDLFFFGAMMFSISYILVYHAELYIISGIVAVAYSASPMLNMLASRLFFGTPLTVRVASASSLGIVGIVCVFWHEFAHLGESADVLLGLFFTVTSVIASSLGSMAAMRTQKRGYPTWTSMAWGMFYGGVLAIVIALLLGRSFTLPMTASYLGTLVYLAIFGSIITFACYLTIMKRIGAAQAGYVGVMVPVVALIVSVFFEKFVWGWLTTAGVALLLVGNVLMLRPPRPNVKN